jgi:hypothetical protein
MLNINEIYNVQHNDEEDTGNKIFIYYICYIHIYVYVYIFM